MPSITFQSYQHNGLINQLVTKLPPIYNNVINNAPQPKPTSSITISIITAVIFCESSNTPSLEITLFNLVFSLAT